MSNEFVTELKALIAKFETAPVVQTVETDVKAIAGAAWAYIKSNGLTDLIGIAESALAGAATGTPYTAILATVVTQGKAAGLQIEQGAEAIVVAQAQADLIAAGKLNTVTTNAPIANPVTVTTASVTVAPTAS